MGMREILKNCINDSSFIDVPDICGRTDYDEAGREFLHHIVSSSGRIKSIYSVGQIGVPGISDMDWFIVFRDDTPDRLTQYDIHLLSPKTRYIFLHDPWYVNEEIFQDLSFWFPFFDLQHVYGDILKTPQAVKPDTALLLAVQYLITKLPADLFLYSISRRKLHVRTMLTIIHSLRYTLDLLQRAGFSSKPAWVDYMKRYEIFRRDWFKDNSSNQEELKQYIVEAILISCELLQEIVFFLRETMAVQFERGAFSVRFKHRVLFFSSAWSPKEMIHAFLQKGGYSQLYPIELGLYVFLWHTRASPVAQQLRRRTGQMPSYQLKEDLKAAFSGHASAIEKYYLFNMRKFSLPGNGYHTLWAEFSSNRMINNFYKFKRKIRELYIHNAAIQ